MARGKLTEAERSALKDRIINLLNDVKPYGYTYRGERRYYYSVAEPSYAEAFGIIQALDALGIEPMCSARKWFDETVDAAATAQAMKLIAGGLVYSSEHGKWVDASKAARNVTVEHGAFNNVCEHGDPMNNELLVFERLQAAENSARKGDTTSALLRVISAVRDLACVEQVPVGGK